MDVTIVTLEFSKSFQVFNDKRLVSSIKDNATSPKSPQRCQRRGNSFTSSAEIHETTSLGRRYVPRLTAEDLEIFR